MQKGGETISKFFKGALEIGTAVNEAILEKVMKVFDLNKGDDAVFRTKNGAPKIMTMFKDKPYSHELMPEYANGSNKFPTVKSMNWEGKTATAKVSRDLSQAHLWCSDAQTLVASLGFYCSQVDTRTNER